MNQNTNLKFDPAVSGRRAYGLVWAAWGAAGLLAGPTLWLFRAVEVEGGREGRARRLDAQMGLGSEQAALIITSKNPDIFVLKNFFLLTLLISRLNTM